MYLKTDKMNSLISKAQETSDLLDKISETLRTLEDGLQHTNANFPFSLEVEIEPESFPKQAEERHKNVGPEINTYATQKIWQLSWEEDPESKNGKFRLFLKCLQKEIVHISHPEDPLHIRDHEFQATIISKIPLRQTKLSIRLRFSKHLQTFIDGFEKHLNNCCVAIKKDNSAVTNLISSKK